MLRGLQAKWRPLHLLSRSQVVQNRRQRSLSTIIPPSSDDRALIPFFDEPSAPPQRFSSPPTGLFSQPNLCSPKDFPEAVDIALNNAHVLVGRILRAPASRQELFKVVKNLDRLSDTLCVVTDLAEFIRHAHPDPRWAAAANEAYSRIYEYMNVLNTSVELCEVLKSVLADRAIVDSLTEEAHETALIFLRDFEKSGIHLPSTLRARFVELSSDIIDLGHQFVSNAARPRVGCQIRRADIGDVNLPASPWRTMRSAFASNGMYTVHPGTAEAGAIMRTASNDDVRRALYVASNASAPEELGVLDELLRTRANLARLVGKPSYAHMTLEDKMVKTPENVLAFLDKLGSRSRESANSEMQMMRRRKQEYLSLASLPDVWPWDYEFYAPAATTLGSSVGAALTPGRVFMALSRLFTHLFGLSFRPADITIGETWHEDVRKLEVVDEREGVIGWIYADLFAREGKVPGAAHYTVRCSRRLDEDDDAAADSEGVKHSGGIVTSASKLRGRDGTYQLPIIVLLCDFAKPTRENGACRIRWLDVMTVFHEMGHAIHTMIGRTDYQNVCGTRCATDFVELPSLLMEHFFLLSPRVQALFYDQPEANSRLSVAQPQTPAIDMHRQILLSSLDQLYHSSAATQSDFDTTKIFATLQDSRGVHPYVPGTSWQTQFSHLYSYGATYYSYIFDKALASAVWHKVFRSNPLSRELGEKLASRVLRHGGARDPWRMISDILEQPELTAGDASAMTEIANWNGEESGEPRGHGAT